MLLYYNGNFIRQLFQQIGSVFWRVSTLSIGFVAAVVTGGLQICLDTEKGPQTSFPHQYPMQTLGAIVTIALVFRTNQAWQRYWEGVTHLHFMYSKWADAFSQFCGFVSVTLMKAVENEGDAKAEEKIAKLRDMHEKVQNDFLLLSAMACDRICRSDCARMERRNELGVPWPDRIVVREDLRTGQDMTNSSGMPKFRITSRPTNIRPSMDEKICDVNMKGFWDAEYVVIKPPTGVKYDLLASSFDRANMVVNWLNHNLAFCSSDLAVAPPIQSRMYQEISNGMLGFNNALKVADVPIAFPHSQVALILVLLWTIFIPFYVVSFTNSLIAGPILAFFLSSFMFCVNAIAAELENPFGQGPNSVCVPEFHARFLLVVSDASRSCYFPPRPPKSHIVAAKSEVLWAYSEGQGTATDTPNQFIDLKQMSKGSFHVSKAAQESDPPHDPDVDTDRFVDILQSSHRKSNSAKARLRKEGSLGSQQFSIKPGFSDIPEHAAFENLIDEPFDFSAVSDFRKSGFQQQPKPSQADLHKSNNLAMPDMQNEQDRQNEAEIPRPRSFPCGRSTS